MSLPVRGAWIEIICLMLERIRSASLPVRGAWIEIDKIRLRNMRILSLPVRGAWIEMTDEYASLVASVVAPRAGSVD